MFLFKVSYESIMSHFVFLLGVVFIWFAPGLIIRRMVEKKNKSAKEEAQVKAIARLYPKAK